MTHHSTHHEIERLSREWAEAFNTDDPPRRVSAFYSADAVLMPPPVPP